MTDPAPPNALPATTLWLAIAQSLRDDLAAGRYRPDDKLPAEADLARRFGVHRHTVRQALADLAAAGEVRSRRGAGTFVTRVATDYPLGRRVRFHRSFAAAGKVPGKRILGIEIRAGTAAECRALALSPGADVHAADGLSLADGEPVALFRSVYPGWLGPGFPQALVALQSVTAALRSVGIADYTRAGTALSAVNADAVQAAHLQLRDGAALLRSEAINVAPDGRPVEYGLTWFAGDRVALRISPDEDDDDPARDQTGPA